MPGINFGTYGGVSTRAQPTSAPMTATAAAFGPGYTTTDPSAMGTALKPDDAFGISFWIGVAALAGLVVIRHSLPH